jgi:hypothetical protein
MRPWIASARKFVVNYCRARIGLNSWISRPIRRVSPYKVISKLASKIKLTGSGMFVEFKQSLMPLIGQNK